MKGHSLSSGDMKLTDGQKYGAKRFGIPAEDILWHHSGICYDRIVVWSRESAEKVSEAVKGEHVNGGWFHGMPLGRISEETRDGKKCYEVMI